MGRAQEFSVLGLYSDGSSRQITAEVSLVSSDDTLFEVGSIDNDIAIIESKAEGQAELHAKMDDLTAKASISILSPELERVALDPESIDIPKGLSASFKAMGHYSDGQILDISESVTWISGLPNIAEPSTEKGSFIGLDQGEAEISAELDGITGLGKTIVSEPVLLSLMIEDLPNPVYVGGEYQLKAIGTLSDQSTSDLTDTVDWALSDESIAGVSPSGILSPLTPGSLVVSASMAGITAEQPTEALDITPATQLTVAGSQVGPVEVPLGEEQNITWSSSNAVSCELKQGMQQVSTDLDGELNIAIDESTTFFLLCENLLGVTSMNSIDVLVIGAPMVTLSVAGSSDSPISVPKNSEQMVSWSSSNAESCNVLHDGVEISNSLTSGTINRIFSKNSIISISCENILGIKASKIISVLAVPAPKIIRFSVAGQVVGPVKVPKNSRQSVAWSAINAQRCTVKIGDTLVSSNFPSRTINSIFVDDITAVSISCFNTLNESVEESIIVNTIPKPSIQLFTVGGNSLSPVKVDNGSVQTIAWRAINATDCKLAQGAVLIDESSPLIESTLSKTVNRTFDVSAKLDIECSNSLGIKAKKSIDVVANLVGNIRQMVNGFYNNPNWGQMVLRIDSNNNVKGTYTYRTGTITGTYNPDTGIVVAWWCEAKNGTRGGQGLEGRARFVFVDESSNIKLTGKWRQGTTGAWNNDWNLTLNPNPNAQIRDRLESRFGFTRQFCYP